MSQTLAAVVSGVLQGAGHLFGSRVSTKRQRRATDVLLRVFGEVEATADPDDDSLAIVLLKSRKRSKALRKLPIDKAAQLVEEVHAALRRLEPRKVTVGQPILAELLGLPATDEE